MASLISKERAAAELARWKSLLPRAEDSYHPSGVVPLLAYPFMVLGAIVGVPVAVLAAAVAVLVGSVFVYLVSVVTGFFLSLPRVFLLVVLVLVGLGLLSAFLFWAATYFLLGAVSGLAVSYFAAKGSNRGTLVSGAVGITAAAAAVAVFFLVVQWAAWNASGTIPQALQEVFGRGLPGLGPYELGAVAWANGVLGSSLAGIVGARTGSIVEKFCERCEEFMTLDNLTPTSLEAAVDMVAAMKEGAGLGEAYQPVDGGPVRVSVWRCPRCGDGYLELNVHFELSYQPFREKEPRTVSESWRCASAPISARTSAELLGKGQRDSEASRASRRWFGSR